ncbi:MAG: lipoyl(octanoyl) transferase LipB [Planctomycetes bacterium]|nr:lipoyl(octanoyl) transferase LipB [Planctomycetota bacterium]
MNAAETKITTFDVLRLGRARYQPVWEMQRRIQAEIIAAHEEGRDVVDRLILVEHEPVFTYGKRAKPANLGAGVESLRALGADVFEVERGGDVTYHGPGQLVAYPVAYLGNLSCGKDLHKYMRGLEEVVLRVLADYGFHGQRVAGLTGVWVDVNSKFKIQNVSDEALAKSDSKLETTAQSNPQSTIHNPQFAKVAAMGTRVSKWATLHGLSLNVTDEPLQWFSRITPCGISDKSVTSLQTLLGKAPPMREVEDRLITHFDRVFGMA